MPQTGSRQLTATSLFPVRGSSLSNQAQQVIVVPGLTTFSGLTQCQDANSPRAVVY